MFIARPSFIFSHLPFKEGNVPEDALHAAGDGIFDPVPATPAERSLAVVCAVIGSFCAATAYATIRVIGKRVHSLVSVNYFAVSATVASFLGLLIIPDIGFKTPQSTAQWSVTQVSCFLSFGLLTRFTGCFSHPLAFQGSFCRCCLLKGYRGREQAGLPT